MVKNEDFHCEPIGTGYYVKMVHKGIYQYDLNLARHRRGLASRQRHRFVAAGPGRHRSAREPGPGEVRRPGVGLRRGRWTLAAAIDEAVPAPVLSAALYERFSSRGEDDFADKVLSALRYEFGGHEEKAAAKKGGA